MLLFWHDNPSVWPQDEPPDDEVTATPECDGEQAMDRARRDDGWG